MAYVQIDGDNKPRFTPTNVKDLTSDVIENVCLCLNPRLIKKDYRSLAGKMKVKFTEVRNLDLLQNPTEELLNMWVSGQGSKTVRDLMDLLEQIERYDVIGILKEHEFTVTHDSNGVNEGKVPVEHGGDDFSDYPNDINNDYDTDEETNISIEENGDRSRSSSTFSFRSRTSTTESRRQQLNAGNLQQMIQQQQQQQLQQQNIHSPKQQQQQQQQPAKQPYESTYDEDGYVHDDIELEKMKNNVANYYGNAIANKENGETPADNDDILAAKMNSEEFTPDNFHPYYGYMDVIMDLPQLSDARRDNNFNNIDQMTASGIPREIGGPIIAADKIALLIGNANYSSHNIQTLLHPNKDVYDFSIALHKLGFKVLSMVDLTLREMRTIMLAYCQLLGPGVFAVFYYAGHGFEENGQNFLMPVDATSEKKETEFVKAQEILTEMQLAQTALNLVIIDTCRVKGISGTISNNNCLRRGENGNTIIAYSCQPSMPAFESRNQRNGVYMSELLPRITKDERIEHILMEVNEAVNGNPLVVQRPVFETDATSDCRLTAMISAQDNMEHWQNKYKLWLQASTPPKPQIFIREKENIHIRFDYDKLFSNNIKIVMSARNLNDTVAQLSGIKLLSNAELEIHEKVLDQNIGPTLNKNIDPYGSNCTDWVPMVVYSLKDLQKISSELLIEPKLKINVQNVTYDIELQINIDFPLVSSVIQQFLAWITKDSRMNTGYKNTWV